MTDNKLMQQIEEIRRRAHVCRYCKGTRERTVYLGDLGQSSMYCAPCEGSGKVPAPDTDALCSALVTAITHIEAIANYPMPDGRVDKDGYPLEMVYDRYAYRRMVDSYRDCAKQALAELEDVLHE